MCRRRPTTDGGGDRRGEEVDVTTLLSESESGKEVRVPEVDLELGVGTSSFPTWCSGSNVGSVPL